MRDRYRGADQLKKTADPVSSLTFDWTALKVMEDGSIVGRSSNSLCHHQYTTSEALQANSSALFCFLMNDALLSE